MNKFTKIILGTGLAVAALGAVAAPATAAPVSTDVSVAAQGDRLEGPARVTPSGWTDNYFQSFGRVHLGHQAVYTTPGNETTWNVPVPGTVGEIRIDGLCLAPGAVTPGTSPYQGVYAEACDGSVNQKWSILANARITSANPALPDMILDGGSNAGAFISPILSSATGLQLNLSTLTPVAPAVTPVDITAATTDTRPVLSGTGDAGATVEITLDNGTVVGSTTVASDGTWTIPSTVDVADGDTKFTATQTATDNSVTTDTITVTILGTPVIDPLIAGGSALALLAVAGGVLVKRRQTAGAAA